MHEPIRLGQLIKLLANQPQDNRIYFDFCRFVPTTIDSYRGYYDQLSVAFENQNEKDTTVAQFLATCRSAIGFTFTGYKGGSYTMGESTFVWVAEFGSSYGTAIVGIDEETTWATILTTRYID